MPFQKIEAEKLSQAVTRQIERLILQGILRPGERLPSERDLSERLAVSRPSLREAISEMQEAGLLTTRAGAGIYVADVLGSAFSPALVRLIGSHEDAVLDYIDFRRDIEALAAGRAAERGSDTDLAVIAELFAKMEAAHSKRNPQDEASLDAEFHMAIIEAGHNVVMLHMMRSMFDLLRQGVFYNRETLFQTRSIRDTLLAQHGAINDAIQSRNPQAARDAVAAHMSYIEAELLARQRSNRDEEIARLRIEHERGR